MIRRGSASGVLQDWVEDMEDYCWLKFGDGDSEDGMEFLMDFADGVGAIRKKLEEAEKMRKFDAKKNIKVSINVEGISSTGLANFNNIGPLKWTPGEARENFTKLVGYFEEFDDERSHLTQSKKKLAKGMVWGYWRKSYGVTCGLNEMTNFIVQHQEPGSNEEGIPRYGTRHQYGNDAPTINWTLQPFKQTGVTYYVGAASFAEIDAVSRVPSFPINLDDTTWGERTLNPSQTDDQFQRPLDLLRMQEIQKFIRPKANRILNSVILYIPPESIESEDAAITLDESEGTAKLTIDVGKFLQEHEDGSRRTYQELHPHRDTRPLMLIDGQHRTRGGAISPEGKDKRVPIVILPPTYSLADAARTFTEINAGSEKLDKLLQLHLRHRFFLQSREVFKDFSDWTQIDPSDSRRETCRANRMAYEIAAICCSRNTSALYGRIRMMTGARGGTNVAIKADVFHELASAWFRKGAPFESEDIGLDSAYEIIGCYFRAWQLVADHESIQGLDPWMRNDGELDDTNRWKPIPQKGTSGKPNAPYITREMPFKAVMMTFPLAYELASHLKDEHQQHPGVFEFIEVLRPTQFIDWSQHNRIADDYGLDKYTPNDLYNWISWALQDYAENKVLHPVEEVWNPENPDPNLCKPGRGFFSPASSKLTQIHPPSALRLWPSEGDMINLWSPLVPNTNRIVRWQLSIDGLPNPEIKMGAPRDGSMKSFTITKEIAQAKEFTVAVFWVRSESGRLSPAARQTLTFTRDSADSQLLVITDETGERVLQPAPPENIDLLQTLDKDQYVIGADFGDGIMMPPPPPNSPRTHSGLVMAPSRFRIPWCPACFFGLDCTKNHCAVRDRGIPKA